MKRPQHDHAFIPHRSPHGPRAMPIKLIDGKWIDANGHPIDIERTGIYRTEFAAIKEGRRKWRG